LEVFYGRVSRITRRTADSPLTLHTRFAT